MNFPTRKLSLAEALQSARETRALDIGKNILGNTPELFRQYFPGETAVIVADEHTMPIAGSTVATALQNAGQKCEAPFVFTDPDLYAEYSYVTQLEESLRKHDAIPIAIGSGAINDITKLAAHNLGRPYMCVATAASMDGYTAFGASITYKGSKQTFNCPAPVAVLADIEIIRNAPPQMTASGYADLLAKMTAGADWMLAEALGIEPIDEQAWNIVQGGLRDALSDPAGVRERDERAIEQLTEGLMLGGFAMQWAKSSRPASGAEHQFSHLWDMQDHTHNGYPPSHGCKVAIGSLAVSALYEHLLQLPIETLDVEKCCAAWPELCELEKRIQEIFASYSFIEKAIEETRAKYISREGLRTQLEQLRITWPKLKCDLRTQLLPFAELKQMLAAAGAPTEPEQIGISRERLRDSFEQAYYIRRRFTVLDFAMRANLLPDNLEALFGDDGIWPNDK
ncbi:MAG: sn-glycerol-1-phosphate dehydrogenase [Verrucomicrobia bacterium]|nr:sn-glycerol-1-phosphate dehydrogenase [Verrucomicrobiota bacterium]